MASRLNRKIVPLPCLAGIRCVLGKFPLTLLLNGHTRVFVWFFAAKWNLMCPSATQMTFCSACWAAIVSSCRNASPNLLQILIQIKR